MTEHCRGDGRSARAERNRAAVVAAFVDLVTAGDPAPPVAAVAARAGVSERSVFRYFADLESLLDTAADLVWKRDAALVSRLDTALALPERVAEFCEQRARLFEAMAPTRRAADRVAHNSVVVAARQTEAHKALRRHAAETFRAELAACTDRRESLDALVAATSWETWDLLRRRQRLSARRAEATVRRMVLAILRAR